MIYILIISEDRHPVKRLAKNVCDLLSASLCYGVLSGATGGYRQPAVIVRFSFKAVAQPFWQHFHFLLFRATKKAVDFLFLPALRVKYSITGVRVSPQRENGDFASFLCPHYSRRDRIRTCDLCVPNAAL